MPACARVSKSWYQAFMPFIWKSISLNKPNPSLLEAVKNHHHLVKTLTLDSRVPKNANLRFPNLKSLSLHSFKTKQHAEVILNHSDIAALRLIYRKSVPGFALWDTLSGFRHLRELSLVGVTIAKKDTNAFWQVCTLLELGTFHEVYVADQSSLSCVEFPRMKKLHILTSQRNNLLLSLEFAQRCPRLESYHWSAFSLFDDAAYLPGFTPLVAAKTWPHLHDVVITGGHKVTRNQLSEILEGMQQITVLTIRCDLDIFTPSSMTLLRPQFSNLRDLVFKDCNQSVMCPMAQEIMSSCPLLEKFSSTWIDADLVVKGKPWVCFGLKKLVLGFVFNSFTLPAVQPIVFDQLSKLTRLEHWRLWPCLEDVPQDTVTLKLEYGLGKLQTLRALDSVMLGNSLQEMEDQEIDWMLEHWKSLRYIRGELCLEEHRKQALTARLKEHGVYCH
ncbi:MAG: hypothetical protein J3Q66DRAFT_371079 [Benniella sp.]|nr:MAG: hypothetical protein J3Q66DRAFT_371079 [Benniella sp.]